MQYMGYSIVNYNGIWGYLSSVNGWSGYYNVVGNIGNRIVALPASIITTGYMEEINEQKKENK